MSSASRTRASVVLQSSDASVVVEPAFGGRLSSFEVLGTELLWQPEGPLPGASHPFGWGSFVMAPYAGRIRRGALRVDGETHQLPVTMPPHAIHGTVHDVAWAVDAVGSGEVTGRACSWVELSTGFGPAWPFAGRVRQRVELFDGVQGSGGAVGGQLRHHLSVDAVDPMPLTMGWHPWFSRRLPGAVAPLVWSFDPVGVRMFLRDADGITTPEMAEIPDGPWDDCFEGLGSVNVRWPGLLRLTVEHDCPVVVLFDGLDHAVCVEPQTGPPDGPAVWGERVMLPAGGSRAATMTWSWSSDADA